MVVELQERREDQPVDARIERAEAVREPLREHRQHAAGEVDRRPARARLVVEDAALRDVVGDVGDVHADPVARRRLLDLDRVVEVLGRLAVDRHDAPVPEVAPAADVLRPHLFREALRLRDDGLGEPGREIVRAEHDLDVHARLAEEAEALFDLAPGDAARVRKRGQARLDDLVLPRAGGLAVDDPDRRRRSWGRTGRRPSRRPGSRTGPRPAPGPARGCARRFRTSAPARPGGARSPRPASAPPGRGRYPRRGRRASRCAGRRDPPRPARGRSRIPRGGPSGGRRRAPSIRSPSTSRRGPARSRRAAREGPVFRGASPPPAREPRRPPRGPGRTGRASPSCEGARELRSRGAARAGVYPARITPWWARSA